MECESINDQYHATGVEWKLSEETSLEYALGFATDNEFLLVRNKCIARIDALMLDSARRIQLAQLYNIPHWLEPEIFSLSARPESLSFHEIEIIGPKVTADIAKRRDSRPKEVLTQTRGLWRNAILVQGFIFLLYFLVHSIVL